jgi:hypothetical protein
MPHKLKQEQQPEKCMVSEQQAQQHNASTQKRIKTKKI